MLHFISCFNNHILYLLKLGIRMAYSWISLGFLRYWKRCGNWFYLGLTRNCLTSLNLKGIWSTQWRHSPDNLWMVFLQPWWSVPRLRAWSRPPRRPTEATPSNGRNGIWASGLSFTNQSFMASVPKSLTVSCKKTCFQ